MDMVMAEGKKGPLRISIGVTWGEDEKIIDEMRGIRMNREIRWADGLYEDKGKRAIGMEEN